MKLTKGKGSVFGDAVILKFQYDPEIISKIKTFIFSLYNVLQFIHIYSTIFTQDLIFRAKGS